MCQIWTTVTQKCNLFRTVSFFLVLQNGNNLSESLGEISWSLLDTMTASYHSFCQTWRIHLAVQCYRSERSMRSSVRSLSRVLLSNSGRFTECYSSRFRIWIKSVRRLTDKFAEMIFRTVLTRSHPFLVLERLFDLTLPVLDPFHPPTRFVRFTEMGYLVSYCFKPSQPQRLTCKN